MDFSILKSNLEKHGFIVTCFDCSQDACDYLDKQIDGKSVGFGGSVTLDQIGVLKRLETHNKVLYRFDNPDKKTPLEVMKDALTADVFLTSANGVAQTGEIINIDGNCNRVAGELYGHEKVYIIVGKNKIAPDFDKALWRARNIAAPKKRHAPQQTHTLRRGRSVPRLFKPRAHLQRTCCALAQTDQLPV